MAHQAFVQQFTKYILSASAEMGTQTIGEQQRRTARHIAAEGTGWAGRLAEKDGSKTMVPIL